MTLVRELVRVAPHAGAHRPALRCAVSVGVPMLVLLALDRVDLLGAAAFGAFTAIYGRDLTAPARTAVQALTGGLLTVSVGVGLLAAHLPGAPWLESAVLVALAGAATVLGGMVDWKPGGPLFLVFAAGAFAGAPAQSAGGAAAVLATTAATAMFSVLVGSAGSPATSGPGGRCCSTGRVTSGAISSRWCSPARSRPRWAYSSGWSTCTGH